MIVRVVDMIFFTIADSFVPCFFPERNHACLIRYCFWIVPFTNIHVGGLEDYEVAYVILKSQNFTSVLKTY